MRWWRSPATEDRNARNLAGQTAFAGVVEGGITTFLPVMLVRMGAGAGTVSMLNAGLALATIVMALPAGPLVARQRRLVPFSARYLFAIRVIFVLIALAAFLPPQWAIAGAVVLWALTGVPAAIANNAFYAVLADAIGPTRRAAVNGARWALLGIVAAACVGAFGFLLDRMAFPAGYQVVFVLSAVGGLCGLWFYGRIEVPDREPGEAPAKTTGGFLAAAFAPAGGGRDFVRFCVLAAAVRLGLHLPIGLFSVFWVDDLGASDTWIGLRSTVANAALPLGYVIWGRLSGRLDPRAVLGASALGFALYPALTAASPDVEWLLPAALAWGFFVAGFDFGLVEGLLRVTPGEARPRLIAAHTLQANLVAFAAPLVGAWLAGIVGIRPVMLLAAALHVGVAVVVAWPLLVGWRARPPHPRTS